MRPSGPLKIQAFSWKIGGSLLLITVLNRQAIAGGSLVSSLTSRDNPAHRYLSFRLRHGDHDSPQFTLASEGCRNHVPERAYVKALHQLISSMAECRDYGPNWERRNLWQIYKS